jgi:hypothetical protein
MNDTLHERLQAAAEALDGERTTLSELAAAHGPAARGSLLVLLAAPCVLPVAGVGTVLGFGMLALALALWRGDAQFHLPPRLAGLSLSTESAQRVLASLARFYRLAGRWSRERWAHLLRPAQRHWLAAKLAFMAFLIILPMPLGNVLPAISVALLGLGLAFRDGMAVFASTLAAVLATVYASAFGLALWWLGAEGMARLF